MDGAGNPVVEEALENVIKVIETQVDEQIERLEKPDEDDLAKLRAARIRDMKERQVNEKKWSESGHGEYTELATEKEFFTVCNGSQRVVAHFYRPSTMRCDIVDKHMKILAPRHMETKFVKLNVEKSPFLTERLNVRIIPSILISVDGKIVDRVVGFTTLGNVDDFSTEMLEWRLAQYDGIEYKGDKLTPPEADTGPKKPSFSFVQKKTIRGKEYDESDEDEESN